MYYPKCKSGYDNFLCCLCRPKTPNCNALGFNGGIDLSCAKTIKVGKPSSASCGSDKNNNAGLCYDKCKSGYYGVGPLCWSNVPSGWVECGLGAAKSKVECGKIVFSQVVSVGVLAINLATMGASSEATATASQSKLKTAFK